MAGTSFNGSTTFQPVPPQRTRRLGWWVVDDGYRVAAGPMDGFHEIADFPVDSWLWRNGARVVVLQRD